MAGDSLVRPVNAPPGISPQAGVQPGTTSNIIRARVVIISGPDDGLFVYSPAPGPGNLVLSITAAGGTDVYGNAYGSGFNIYGPGGGAINMSLFESDPIIIMTPANTIEVPFIPPQIQTLYAGSGPAGFLQMDLNAGAPTVTTPGVKLIMFSSSPDGVTSVGHFSFYGGPSGQLIADINELGISAANPAIANTVEVWHSPSLLNGWFNTSGFQALQYQKTAANSVWVNGVISGTDATSATFLTLPPGYIPALPGGAPVGATGAVPTGAAPQVRWDASGNLGMFGAGTFPQGVSYFIDLEIPLPPPVTTSPTIAGPVAQLALAAPVGSVPGGGFQPTGPTAPAGKEFALAFDDEFNYGTSGSPAAPDPTRWAQLVGYAINGTSCLGDAACAYVIASQGLILEVASATQGAYISSAPSDGAGVNGWVMPTNAVVEIQVMNPVNGGGAWLNWGTFFTSGQAWPTNGEADLWEINSLGPSANYHWQGSGGEQQAGPYQYTGVAGGTFYIATLVRTTTQYQYWINGVMQKEWPLEDEGGAQSLLCLNGAGNTSAYGQSNAAIIRYVRGWVIQEGGGGGSLAYRDTPATSQSSGGVTSFSVNKQPGTVAGDFIGMLLFGANSASVACSGFTVVQDVNDYGAFLYREADGTEGSAFNITGLGSQSVTIGIFTVAQATLDSTVGNPTSSSNSTSLGVASINVGTAGDWVIWAAGNDDGYTNVSYAITQPSGYTSRATNGAQTQNPCVMIADNQDAASGATGVQTGTSSSATYWSGIMVALKPA